MSSSPETTDLVECVACAIYERATAMQPLGRPGTWRHLPQNHPRRSQARADAEAAIDATVKEVARRLVRTLGEMPGNHLLQKPNGEMFVDGCFTAAELTAALGGGHHD